MNPAISVHLSLRATSSLEEIFVIDLHPDRDLPPCDDGDFALFAAVMVTQAADCPADFQSGEEALPKMLRLGATQNAGLHVSPLSVSSSSLSGVCAVFSAGEHDNDRNTGASKTNIRPRQADVRTRPLSREVSTAA